MANSIARLALHLSLLKGVGPGLCKKLHETLGTHFQHLYQLNVNEVISFGFSTQTAQLIVGGLANKHLIEKEIELAEKHNVTIITIFDENYPKLLREIHLPPIALYCKGASVENSMLAIVGSRNANGYAQNVIDQIVPVLVGHQFSIVSGGALGADAMAHRATLKVGGKTVVILGSGLLKWYPSQNHRLFQDVLDNNGLLISSFPLETSPAPGNFPARNRIIAGLSRGCIVVQAAQESGAKITALYALEQGRDVFAVPGSINDPLSAGCHSLIQQGAKLVHNAHDILTEYNIHNAGTTIEEKNIPMAVEQITLNFSLPLAQRILNACSKPLSLDQLIELLNVDLQTCQAALFDLQISGMVEQNMNGMWCKSL